MNKKIQVRTEEEKVEVNVREERIEEQTEGMPGELAEGALEEELAESAAEMSGAPEEETKDDSEEIQRYLNGLRRYTEKGIPIYMDGEPSGPAEWEKLFLVREDGMFYMGDYVQAEAGGLKEIRFDKVYHSGDSPNGTRKRRKERQRRKEN